MIVRYSAPFLHKNVITISDVRVGYVDVLFAQHLRILRFSRGSTRNR